MKARMLGISGAAIAVVLLMLPIGLGPAGGQGGAGGQFQFLNDLTGSEGWVHGGSISSGEGAYPGPQPTTPSPYPGPPTATPTPYRLFLPVILKSWIRPLDLIVNGGFECDEAWVIPVTRYSAGYTTTVCHTGLRAVRLGIVDPVDNRHSYSTMRQQVTLPADATRAILQFWIYPFSGEAGPVPTPMPRPQGGPELMGYVPYDVQYLLVLDRYERWIDTLLWQCTDDREWTRYEFDLISYAGRTIQLHFGVYNNGWDGLTGAYLDDVSLQLVAP